MAKTQYRSTNVIICTLLEGILRSTKIGEKAYQREGIIKSHLVKYGNLKTATAEKYLEKMINAGYVKSYEEPWGERKRIIFTITSKGKERYQWFVKINTELG